MNSLSNNNYFLLDRVEVLDNPEMEEHTARPLQIVTTGEEHTFVLDEDTLTEVLLQDNIRDRFVVVVSVAGAFRKGKSFLLDFFLRYMYSKVSCSKRFKNLFKLFTNVLHTCFLIK